jgi:hypothetical protein
MLKIRVILDVKDDVFRDILIDGNANLEQLHFAITKAFGFNGQEMASFYKSNQQWEQGDEIPLFEMEEGKPSMTTCIINKKLNQKGDKLIYVYDFLEMWTFFVELLDLVNPTEKYDAPTVIASIGKTPRKAPKKEFKGESKKKEDDYGYDSNSELDSLDDLNDEDDFNDDFDHDDMFDDDY